ncbi:MAG TPA: sortase [Candidatus Bathyarchaeia archaeon]|nr:sortase [Candidatus Bathyarchaeia archaeon]
MALYCYVKSSPRQIPRITRLPPRDGQSRFLSGFLISLGIFVVILVLSSIGVYQIRTRSRFDKKMPLFSPIPRSVVLGESEVDSNSADYTNPHQWFSSAPPMPLRNSKITHYNLSIPVLGIYQAIVEIGGEDLGKSMVHYPGTSLPGQRGSAVLFCHSVLPQFFNPKNYKTICSTLPALEIGDEIIVYFDGIEYHYQVFKMTEVQPTDISVLEQDMTGEYLSMITCVPPGTYLRRLVVKARLI